MWRRGFSCVRKYCGASCRFVPTACRFASMRALARAGFAVVLPAFQIVNDTSDATSITHGGKPAVQAALQRKAVTRFQPECAACHKATAFDRWLATPDDAPPYAINFTTGCAFRAPILLQTADGTSLLKTPCVF